MKWKGGQGKTDSFTVWMEDGERLDVPAQPDGLTEYSAVIPTPVLGNNYYGNISAFADGISSNPALFGFTFGKYPCDSFIFSGFKMYLNHYYAKFT